MLRRLKPWNAERFSFKMWASVCFINQINISVCCLPVSPQAHSWMSALSRTCVGVNKPETTKTPEERCGSYRETGKSQGNGDLRVMSNWYKRHDEAHQTESQSKSKPLNIEVSLMAAGCPGPLTLSQSFYVSHSLLRSNWNAARLLVDGISTTAFQGTRVNGV